MCACVLDADTVVGRHPSGRYRIGKVALRGDHIGMDTIDTNSNTSHLNEDHESPRLSKNSTGAAALEVAMRGLYAAWGEVTYLSHRIKRARIEVLYRLPEDTQALPMTAAQREAFEAESNRLILADRRRVLDEERRKGRVDRVTPGFDSVGYMRVTGDRPVDPEDPYIRRIVLMIAGKVS